VGQLPLSATKSSNEFFARHYQDAYAMLVVMFGSTATLPPRTKRWAEAKVLADSINVKVRYYLVYTYPHESEPSFFAQVSKLYLYNNEHALALSHHNTHMRKFGDFSRGWGIGEETFEFWSWMARQYALFHSFPLNEKITRLTHNRHRVFAELLEQGTRSTLTIPSHKPVPPPSPIHAAAAAAMPKGVNALDAASLGLNPSHALHHPGFYYYMAARCTEMRRTRFLAAVDATVTMFSQNSY
jgi:hypothetical protein